MAYLTTMNDNKEKIGHTLPKREKVDEARDSLENSNFATNTEPNKREIYITKTIMLNSLWSWICAFSCDAEYWSHIYKANCGGRLTF